MERVAVIIKSFILTSIGRLSAYHSTEKKASRETGTFFTIVPIDWEIEIQGFIFAPAGRRVEPGRSF
jgi:hypothetical protein